VRRVRNERRVDISLTALFSFSFCDVGLLAYGKEVNTQILVWRITVSSQPSFPS